MNVLVGASLFILLLILAAGVFVGPPPSAPGQDGRRTGGIYDVPVLGQLAEGAADLWESFGGALNLATTPAGDEALVGIGAVVGYTGTTGESQVFTEWRQSGLLMSGVAIVDPLSGISVRPDNPRYRALKLYDEATGAEGEVWFQPIVAIRTVNGTPVSHSVAVAAKTILVCDNGAQEILSYNREVREGQGAPGQIQFSRHAAKGGISGTTRTITFTETRVIVSTAPGATVTQTRTVARTETVVMYQATTVTAYVDRPVTRVITTTVSSTVYVYGGYSGAGVVIPRGLAMEPYHAFIFAPAAR